MKQVLSVIFCMALAFGLSAQSTKPAAKPKPTGSAAKPTSTAVAKTPAAKPAATTVAKPATPKVEKVDAPSLKFETSEVDYATVEQDSEPFRVFKFVNNGNAPVTISNATGSCGCTVPTYPKEPIMPGETSEIKVRYDTHRVGGFQKTVTLTTNLAESQITLRIKGDVYEKKQTPGVPSTGGSMLKPNNN